MITVDLSILAGKDVVLFPFSERSVLLYHALGKVTCFFDNNLSVHGKQYDSCPIVSPDCTMNMISPIIILCEPHIYESNEAQLKSLGFNNIIRISELLTPELCEVAIRKIDINMFFLILPKKLKEMRSIVSRNEPLPPCYLESENFHVSFPETLCNTGKCRFCDNEDFFSLVESLRNLDKKPIFIMVQNPFNTKKMNGFWKRVLAVDELFSGDHLIKVYLSETTGNVCGKQISIEKVDEYTFVIEYSNGYDSSIGEICKLIKIGSGVYVHSVYNIRKNITKHCPVPLVLDAHGIVPEEEELLGNRYNVPLSKANEEYAFINFACVVFVTNAMEKHFRNKYPRGVKNSLVIPIFDRWDDKQKLPKHTRTNNGICNVIYTGGADKWQKVDLMMQAIRARREYRYRIVTADVEAFEEMLGDCDDGNIEIYASAPEKVIDDYLVSDYGFVLREDIDINNVACPTKLTEYCRYGVVPIMLTDNIGDFHEYGIKYISLLDFMENKLKTEDERYEMAEFNYTIANKLYDGYLLNSTRLVDFFRGSGQ